jgi:hypothetical protein
VKRPYLDVDSDDSFLDLPEPRYGPDGRSLLTGDELDEVLTDDYRRKHHLSPPPELPPVGWRESDDSS